MRLILAAALFAAFTMSAQAQETTTAAPAAVPPSACPPVPAPPAQPNWSRATPEQVTAAVAAYEAWNASTGAPLQCLAAESRALQEQSNARAAEHAAALEAGRATGAEWQAALNAYNERRRR